MTSILSIKSVSKKYKCDTVALTNISLDIKHGEIFALLGPNGAGKTTLISSICGITKQSSGTIIIKWFDTLTNWRQCRKIVGLVPQELTLELFETVWSTLVFSRGLFGKPPNTNYLKWILDALSLSDKKNTPIMQLSGGMKRRVLIAKALAHQPDILFLDEPTAGVDVALRKNLWQLVSKLRETGVTIILTTHYIEEAEAIADRIGIINKGQILLVENKNALMNKMGEKILEVDLQKEVSKIPAELSSFNLALSEDKKKITFRFDKNADKTGITKMLSGLSANGIIIKDLKTQQSTLEEIFLNSITGKK